MSNIGTRTKRSPSKDTDSNNVNRTPLSQAFREIVFKNNGNNRQSNGAISPSRVTRLQEKEEMQNLNDRLVIYIDNVRRLESENNRLQALVNTYSENSTRDVSEIKALYERELDDAKRLIDDLAKEKAKLEIEVNKYKTDAEEATLKLSRRDKELKKMDADLKSIESEAQAYKARYETLQTENARKTDELGHLKPHVQELEKQLAKLKKQLDEETMIRVDNENKLQVLKQDLQFKTQLFDKEVDQVRSSKRVEIEQVDVKLRDEYDSRLLAELQRIRDETENKIQEMKDEVERRYQNKLTEYQANAKRELQASFALRDEISSYKTKIDELQADIKAHQVKLAANDLKIKDLEERLKKSSAKYETDIAVRDSELTGLRKEIQDLLLEYQELYDIKIALDMEIGAYRKLLESEEQRLNISAHGATHAHLQILGDSYLDEKNQSTASSSRTGKKRRMNTQLNQTDQEENNASMPGTPLKNSTTIQKVDASFKKATTTTTTSNNNNETTVNKTKSSSKLFSFW